MRLGRKAMFIKHRWAPSFPPLMYGSHGFLQSPPHNPLTLTAPPLPSSTVLLEKLRQSYPDLKLQRRLEEEGEAWITKPLSVLDYEPRSNSPQSSPCPAVRIYSSWSHFDEQIATHQLLKRIYCVGFVELYGKTTTTATLLI